MLDAHIRPWIDPPLTQLSKKLIDQGLTANTVTLIGFGMGLLSMPLIMQQYYKAALLFIIFNRISDGLDGAIARQTKLTDFGGILDIVCDFIFYAGVVFAFAFTSPQYSFWAAFLIFSFIGPITSFLAYAIIAAKHNHQSSQRGKKSFYHLGGICEGTETISVLVLICLFPGYFPHLCCIYGILCWITTIGRVYNAWRDFKST